MHLQSHVIVSCGERLVQYFGSSSVFGQELRKVQAYGSWVEYNTVWCGLGWGNSTSRESKSRRLERKGGCGPIKSPQWKKKKALNDNFYWFLHFFECLSSPAIYSLRSVVQIELWSSESDRVTSVRNEDIPSPTLTIYTHKSHTFQTCRNMEYCFALFISWEFGHGNELNIAMRHCMFWIPA